MDPIFERGFHKIATWYSSRRFPYPCRYIRSWWTWCSLCHKFARKPSDILYIVRASSTLRKLKYMLWCHVPETDIHTILFEESYHVERFWSDCCKKLWVKSQESCDYQFVFRAWPKYLYSTKYGHDWPSLRQITSIISFFRWKWPRAILVDVRCSWK